MSASCGAHKRVGPRVSRAIAPFLHQCTVFLENRTKRRISRQVLHLARVIYQVKQLLHSLFETIGTVLVARAT